MINNSALSSQMNVADLAPKAASKPLEARRGDSAFGEALAGAHSVHDRRESQAATNSRRDWAQGDRTADRTRGQDRAAEVRSDASDRAERPDRGGIGDDVTTTGDAAATTGSAVATDEAAATTDTDATTTTTETGETTTAPTAEADGEGAVDAAVDAGATGTVVVAAAPAVVADLDAIIVPTAGAVTQVASDAVDAAVKLAISGEAAAETAVVTTAVAATTTVDVDADVATNTQATAAIAQGAEDVETGDVQAGPTRPSTTTPVPTSGPSPVQLAAATFTADADVDAAAAPAAVQATVAAAATVEVAEGTSKDAGAVQLVQAAVVETETDAADAAPVVDDAATVKAAKADATLAGAAGAEVEVVDAEEPEVVQAARLTQAQAPTVAVNAQAQAQAKAAEQAAEEGSDSAAPAKLEPLPTQAAPVANAARGEGLGAAARMREGLQAQVQERIDHIADQLATRLRLSHAAGGSQVNLSLKPRELGEVTVQMNVRDGAVAATILVDKADTLRTLQTNIEDLKRSLESQGLAIGEFSVDVRGDSGAGGANARAAADLRNASDGRAGGAAASLAGAAAATPGLSGDREVSAEDVHDGDVSVLA